MKVTIQKRIEVEEIPEQILEKTEEILDSLQDEVFIALKHLCNQVDKNRGNLEATTRHLSDLESVRVGLQDIIDNFEDLSNFMGYADYADHKVLFTNSDTLPKIMRDRKDFFCIRGNDLDRLEAQDFESILQWMRGEKFEPQFFTPRSHQQEAIDKILEGLKSKDRVTSVMPCGTGKTLVAFWVAQQLDAKNILVLVPSLALLRQTLHVWRTQTRKIPKLAVCSDPTVRKGNDNLVIENNGDLDNLAITPETGVVIGKPHYLNTYPNFGFNLVEKFMKCCLDKSVVGTRRHFRGHRLARWS